MNNISYQSTILQGTGKAGVVKCGADGYYDMLAGGFDAYNSAGAFYDWNSAKPFFDASHNFQRRIKNGALFGEDGHPVFVPGMSKEQWIDRTLTIDADRRSHHIAEVYVEMNGDRNRDGSYMHRVWIRVKPMGARAQVVADALENPRINSAFSIRCLTKDIINPYTKLKTKIMLEIVTFDFVDEPGIYTATKYNNPSMECYEVGSSDIFTRQQILAARKYSENIHSGFESGGLLDRYDDILERSEGGILIPKQGITRAATIPQSSHWR